MRRLLAAALVVWAPLVAAAATPAAAGGGGDRPPAGPSRIRLASQTPWVGPGQELVLRLQVSTPVPPPEVEVAVAVYRRTTSRFEFTRTLDSRPRGAPLSVTSTPLSELAPDSGGALVVRLPVQDPALPPELSKLRLGGEGVYPVRVELREVGGGPSLAELVTHLVHASPPREGRPLGTGLVLPVHAPPSIQPHGGRRLPPGTSENLSALGRILAAHPRIPLTLAPTPETLQALATSPREGDRETLQVLARGAAGRQVTAATFVPIALPALVQAGLDSEAAAQLDRGGEVIDRTLGARPDPRIWLSDERLDEPSVQRLRQQRSDRLVLRESSLVPVELPITPAQPFDLEVRARRRPQVLAADNGLAGHFADTDDPVLAAHRLLADLATIYFDRPGRPRAVVAMPPRNWKPSTAFLDTLLAGLATSPILAGVTLDAAFATVPPATNPGGAPMVRRLAPAQAGTSALPASAVRSARRRIESFGSMLEPGNPVDDNIEDVLLVAEGADLRPRQRSAYVDGVNARIDDQLDLIEIPPSRSITLTARRGEIPVTIISRADHSFRLRVQVASDKLEFPAGAERTIELARRNTTQRFSVEARTSGRFPLRVNLVSPDGDLVLGRSRLTVRSTATSGVGVVLSAGAGTFLLLWWGRHQLQGRRNRRLVPA